MEQIPELARIKPIRWIYRNKWILILIVCFFIINLARITRHEMWRDEILPWTVILAKETPLDTIVHTMKTGHPPLWHFCLWPLKGFTEDPFAVQLLHLFIGTLSAFIILYRAPFNLLIRILLITGYFFTFEYLMISRCYALGVLFLLLFCWYYSRPDPSPAVSAVLLGLLTWTSAYGLILALALIIGLLLSLPQNSRKLFWFRFLPVFLLFMLSAIFFMLPPENGTFQPRLHLSIDIPLLTWILKYAFFSIVPLFKIDVQFWNNPVTLKEYGLLLPLITTCSAILMIMAALRKSLISLMVLTCSILGVVLFQYIFYPSVAYRYSGTIFLCFIACLWLSEKWSDGSASKARTDLFSKIAVVLLLLVHTCTGVYAAIIDWNHPFSMGKATAEYIAKHGLDQRPIFADIDFRTLTVAGYLNRPFHYPNGEYGTFLDWTRERIAWDKTRTGNSVVEKLLPADPLFILSYPLSRKEKEIWSLEEIARFEGAIQADENYYLYHQTAKTDQGTR